MGGTCHGSVVWSRTRPVTAADDYLLRAGPASHYEMERAGEFSQSSGEDSGASDEDDDVSFLPEGNATVHHALPYWLLVCQEEDTLVYSNVAERCL